MSRAPRKKSAKSASTSSAGTAKTADDSEHRDQVEVVDLLDRLPANLPDEVKASIIQSISFQGPLPPPAMLRGYEEVIEGGADRCFRLAEREQEMRDRANCKGLHNDRIRIVGAIGVSVLLIAVAAFAAYLDHPLLAGSLGLAGIFAAVARSVVGAFSPERARR